MRIAYVLTSLGVGGAERQVIGLACRMAERGHVVRIFVLLPRAEGDWPTVPVEAVYLDMHRQPWSVLHSLVHGVTKLHSFRPDVIHGHHFHGNMAARFFSLFCRRTRVLSTIHNVYEGGGLRMLAYRMTSRLSTHTTAVSNAAHERFVRLRAISSRSSSVLANGIETAEFIPVSERRLPMRAELHAGSDFIWLAVGRLAPAKDYPNLLHAFAQVCATGAATQLWIAGDGVPETADQLDSLCSSLGLADVVHRLGRRMDVPALLDAADAFVLASAWEGMPLAVGEAMAMEKPIVATDVGGVRELLAETGRLVPAQSSEMLAQAMLDAMHTPLAERDEQGKAARKRVCKSFNMDAKAEEWERLYESITQ